MCSQVRSRRNFPAIFNALRLAALACLQISQKILSRKMFPEILEKSSKYLVIFSYVYF